MGSEMCIRDRSNLIAGPFGFKAKDYFEIDDADAALPDVEFGA